MAETRANEAEHRYQKVTTDLTNLVARVDQARKDVAGGEARRDTSKTEIESADQSLAALRATVAKEEAKRDELTRDEARLDTQVQRLKAEKESLQKEIGRLEAQRPSPASTNK